MDVLTAERQKVLFEGEGAVRVMQLNVFGGTRRSVEHKLRQWYKLSMRVQTLQEQVNKKKERRHHLIVDYPSIIQVLDDMPRATGVSDKTGNHVANKIDRMAELDEAIQELELELSDAEDEFFKIERAVNELREEERKIVRSYYLENLGQVRVCDSILISKSSFYRRLYAILDSLADILGES